MTVAIRSVAPKVWSVAPYFNEEDVLRIRLREQRDAVDVFVFCEAAWTYAGSPKPKTCWKVASDELGIAKDSWYAERLVVDGAAVGRILFGEAEDGTRLVVVELRGEPPLDYATLQDFWNQSHIPDAKRRWQRENYQRAMLTKGLRGVEERDVVVLSDLDEIVSPRLIDFYVDAGYNIMLQPALPLHVGALNWRWREPVPVIARLFRGRVVVGGASMEDVRRAQCIQVYPSDVAWARTLPDPASAFGWHLSYMGGVEAMRYKVREAAHPEMETSDAALRAQLERGLDLFGRTYKVSEYVEGDALPRAALDFPSLMVERPEATYRPS